MSDAYYSEAKMAMRYVKGKIDIGASNKFSDMLLNFGAGAYYTGAMRNEVDKELRAYPDAAYVNQYNEPEFNRRYLYASADKAAQFGCGNCGEQSALAFVYLENHKVFPIEWVCTASWSHAFVIVNRAADSDLNKFWTWGKAAVVCDPWRSLTDYALCLPNILNGLKLTLLYTKTS